MPQEIYAVVAMGMRYWFLFLGVLIVLRSFSWLRKDSRDRKRRVKRLPDAGYVGEFVVLAGGEQLPVGTVISLPREGTLGSLRTCDVVVPVEGVLNKHLAFAFKNGKGLFVEPYFKAEFEVDGEANEKMGRPMVLYHGSRLTVGEAVLRMRLFVGVDAPRPVKARGFTPVYEWEESPVHHQQAQLWQTDRFAPITDDYEDYQQYEEYEDEPLYEEEWDERGHEE